MKLILQGGKPTAIGFVQFFQGIRGFFPVGHLRRLSRFRLLPGNIFDNWKI